jgi:hypothetical protein
MWVCKQIFWLTPFWKISFPFLELDASGTHNKKYEDNGEAVMKERVREYRNSSCGCASPLDSQFVMITLDALYTYSHQTYWQLIGTSSTYQNKKYTPCLHVSGYI